MTAEEQWSSRTTFVLAAVGSAVGLGNLWRFPYVVYDSGGAVFLIPWLIALVTAGFPLLVLEMAVGCWGRSKFNVTGAPAAFEKIERGMRWIGWGTLANGFIIVCFYAVVMGWAFVYLFKSFSLAWGTDAEGHFMQQVLHISSAPKDINKIVAPVLAGAVLSWICIYLAIFKGTKVVSAIVKWTVPLPVFIIIVFVIRGLTLEGSLDGIAFYLRPDWSKLTEPRVWLAAYSQVFFSITLAFGVMPAYASYLPKGSDINANAVWVVALDAAISFIAGFAVFTVLGFLALQKGVAVSEVVASGPGLAFVTYPTAISLLPVLPRLFGFLFFLTLITLAIDSAFSLVEGSVAGLHDYAPFTREAITLVTCLAAMTGGLLFCTDAGLYWLDIVDHHINNFGLTIFGLFECIAIGWIFGADKMRAFINSTSDFAVGRWWNVCIKYVTPGVLLVIMVTTLVERIKVPYSNYSRLSLFIGGWGVVLLTFVVAIIFSKLFRLKEKA
ncbi:MAG: sodium-dependent transporter [Candidatus Abyssubacteria bacterium]